jgi:hypothetical protein
MYDLNINKNIIPLNIAEYAITRKEHFSFLAFLSLSVLLLSGSLPLAGSETIYAKTTMPCSSGSSIV